MKNSKMSAKQHLTKKRMGKLLVLGMLLVVVVLVFGYTQLSWFKSPGYLLSMAGEGGAIVSLADEDGCFKFVLKDVDHVVWFSYHPKRDAFSAPITTLVDSWSEYFEDSPPNADLQLFSEDGSDPMIILTLEDNPIWDEDSQTLRFNKACPIELTYRDGATEIKPVSIEGNTFSKAWLFIDDFSFGKWIWQATKDVMEVRVDSTKAAGHPKDTPQGIPGANVSVIEDGDKASEGIHDSISTIFHEADYGHWQEHSSGYLVKIKASASVVGGEIGEATGGSEGRRIGHRVGAVVGGSIIKKVGQIILSADVDDDPDLINPYDTYIAIRGAARTALENLKVAYVLTDNILEEEEENIRTFFLDTLNTLGEEYDKSTFCGESISEDSLDVLYDIVLYSLRDTLEGRISHDLDNGMSVEETALDVAENLESDLELVILYSLWELKDDCAYDENDLYTFIFRYLFVLGANPSGISIPADPSLTVGKVFAPEIEESFTLGSSGSGAPNVYYGHGLEDEIVPYNHYENPPITPVDPDYKRPSSPAVSEASGRGDDFGEFEAFMEAENARFLEEDINALAEEDAAGGGKVISFIKAQLLRFTRETTDELLGKVEAQFNTLTADGFTFYGSSSDIDFGGFDEAMIDEMVEEALESTKEEVLEDVAEDGREI